MDNRKWESDAIASPPTVPASPSGGYPTNGNPLSAQNATEPGAWWFHAVGEEIRAVILEAGFTPNINTLTQLRDAIKSIANGGDYKSSVRVASTVAINLAAPGANIDGIAMVVGDRFLEKDNATLASRGIYIWNGAAVPATRAEDADNGYKLNSGSIIPVEEGAINGNTNWQLATDGIVTIGTTALSFLALIPSKKKLAAAITFYVATTGSDSNDGLTVGTPFLTLQKAWDNLFNNYDLNGNTVTIQVADGTYTSGVNAQSIPVGQASIASIVFNGNAGTPGNVIISTTNANCFSSTYNAFFTVQNMRLQTTTSGSGLSSVFQGQIRGGAGLIFGACASSHIQATNRGNVFMSQNYSIVGAAPNHFQVTAAGLLSLSGLTVTVTGTPAFSSAFALCTDMGLINCFSSTFSGAATGTRYTATALSLIETQAGGANYFPGNVAGAVFSGSQYV